MNIIFDDFATEEFKDTIDYYELQVQGIGRRFKEKIKRASRNIQKSGLLRTVIL